MQLQRNPDTRSEEIVECLFNDDRQPIVHARVRKDRAAQAIIRIRCSPAFALRGGRMAVRSNSSQDFCSVVPLEALQAGVYSAKFHRNQLGYQSRSDRDSHVHKKSFVTVRVNSPDGRQVDQRIEWCWESGRSKRKRTAKAAC